MLGCMTGGKTIAAVNVTTEAWAGLAFGRKILDGSTAP